MGACQQTERHSKFLSYLTGARQLLSAVSVLVVAQPSSDVLEGLMNYPVYLTASGLVDTRCNSPHVIRDNCRRPNCYVTCTILEINKHYLHKRIILRHKRPVFSARFELYSHRRSSKARTKLLHTNAELMQTWRIIWTTWYSKLCKTRIAVCASQESARMWSMTRYLHMLLCLLRINDRIA
jgi:hypothetical protein